MTTLAQSFSGTFYAIFISKVLGANDKQRLVMHAVTVLLKFGGFLNW